MSDIMELLTKENAKQLAKDIIEIFVTTSDNRTLTCSFDVSAGKMVETDANTWFNFDALPDTKLEEFKKALFERELANDENKELESFIRDIQKILEVDYHDVLEQTVRETLMPANSPKKIPMTVIKVNKLEIADASPVPYFARFTIKIARESQDAQVDTRGILERLSELRDEPENEMKTAKALFLRHKDEEVFDGVADIVDGDRFLFDANLTLYVDYSMSDDFLEAVHSGDIERVKQFA